MGLQTDLQFYLKGTFTHGLWKCPFLSTYIVKNLLKSGGKRMAIAAHSTGCISLRNQVQTPAPTWRTELGPQQWGGRSRWVPGALQPASRTNKNKANESTVSKNQDGWTLRNHTQGFHLASKNRCTHGYSYQHPCAPHKHKPLHIHTEINKIIQSYTLI